jgi:hypothetical protein
MGTAAVERWNGKRWRVESAPSPSGSELVAVSAVSPSDVWAVGRSHEATSVLPLIEHWNGVSWRIAHGPRFSGELAGVFALTPRNIWAVGTKWITQGANSRGLIEHWNGVAWSIVPSPQTDNLASRQLEAVDAVSSRDVWAVGYDDSSELIEHWNGRRWATVPSANTTDSIELRAVAALSSKDIWAVGNDGQSSQAFAEHWNGRGWRMVNTGHTGDLYALATVSSRQVWAVGKYMDSQGIYHSLIERWNGRRWKAYFGMDVGHGRSQLNRELFGVSASSAANVWAVGTFADVPPTADAGGLYGKTAVGRWTGRKWSVVSSPNPSAASAEMTALDFPGGSNGWAVGDTLVDGSHQGLVERWNGRRWVAVSSPRIYGRDVFLNSVEAVGPHDVWAVGSNEIAAEDIEDLDVGSRRLIEHWNGHRWSTVPGVMARPWGELFGVSADSPRDVWAVGWDQQNSNSATFPLVERWNGSGWRRIPDPPGMDEITAQDQNGPLTYEIVALSARDVWVASTFGTLDHWNGSGWTGFRSPGGSEGSAYLYGLGASSPRNVWSAGYSFVDADNPYLSLASRWNGHMWEGVRAVDTTGENVEFNGIAAIGAWNVWAVGYDDGGLLTEHWNGKAFHVVPARSVPGGGDYRSTFAYFASVDGTSSATMSVGSYQVDGALVPIAQRFVVCR